MSRYHKKNIEKLKSYYAKLESNKDTTANTKPSAPAGK
jgi:hypothetical protein